MDDDVQTEDPDFVPPTIEISTMEVARLAGLLIGAQEYLEALNRVAMFESRPRPRCYANLRLARDVLVQWSRENVVSADACTCPEVGSSYQRECPVHDV